MSHLSRTMLSQNRRLKNDKPWFLLWHEDCWVWMKTWTWSPCRTSSGGWWWWCNGVQSVCLAQFGAFINTNQASFECHSLFENCFWTCTSIYTHSLPNHVIGTSSTITLRDTKHKVISNWLNEHDSEFSGLRRSEFNFGMWQNERFMSFMNVKLTAVMWCIYDSQRTLWMYIISQV